MLPLPIPEQLSLCPSRAVEDWPFQVSTSHWVVHVVSKLLIGPDFFDVPKLRTMTMISIHGMAQTSQTLHSQPTTIPHKRAFHSHIDLAIDTCSR
eukprot:5907689-Amphidinium_carterae.1